MQIFYPRDPSLSTKPVWFSATFSTSFLFSKVPLSIWTVQLISTDVCWVVGVHCEWSVRWPSRGLSIKFGRGLPLCTPQMSTGSNQVTRSQLDIVDYFSATSLSHPICAIQLHPLHINLYTCFKQSSMFILFLVSANTLSPGVFLVFIAQLWVEWPFCLGRAISVTLPWVDVWEVDGRASWRPGSWVQGKTLSRWCRCGSMWSSYNLNYDLLYPGCHKPA